MEVTGWAWPVMPDASPGPRRDTLGLRLALAFLAVALAAVALLAGHDIVKV